MDKDDEDYGAESRSLRHSARDGSRRKVGASNTIFDFPVRNERDYQGHATHYIFLGISKAFDKITHDLLANTLDDSVVPGWHLFWILSFLENGTLQARVGDCYSPTTNATSGIPQGSVLGPLLFLIFVNGLSNAVMISSAFHADYFKIWSKDPDALQNVISICVERTSNHGLPVNQAKTMHMAFNCSEPPTFLLNFKDDPSFSIPIVTS
jgi:hypothetical protein